MVVNDYAGELDERGALESIASKLALTVFSVGAFFCGSWLACDGR
jgi:hypothetical protein